MFQLAEILRQLDYENSPHYHPRVNDEQKGAALTNMANQADVAGVYVFNTNATQRQPGSAVYPAVFVTEAANEDDAHNQHRKLWNRGDAPFILQVLPDKIKIYTGFDYSEDNPNVGVLGDAPIDHLRQVRHQLAEFTAFAIDSGALWRSGYAAKLTPDRRVDHRLLRNLKTLGNALCEDGLTSTVAHALIGKYVYLRYLKDRGILTEGWLTERRIEPKTVFSARATRAGLHSLVMALEPRFNGNIFPMGFDQNRLSDHHVSWVAAVFNGDELLESAPVVLRQLHLPFRAYNFNYIPVELLSTIYEQFIQERKAKGAIYTPEIVADYLLSEMESVKPLQEGMRVLDPACGSGVFLVLAYRRLIEKAITRLDRRLRPEELCEILTHSIYGVEREEDACYVTEFSLILMLMHYIEPRDLRTLNFQFPVLHNRQIFKYDFFNRKTDTHASSWHSDLKFDWIVGNPPWIEIKPTAKEPFARAWMQNADNKRKRPIGGNRVAEAFSWLVTDSLSPEGLVGLIMPATSLFNLESQAYRQKFFSEHTVHRITNFANLRDVLFGKRKSGVLPAATLIYQKVQPEVVKPEIMHIAPLAIEQLTTNVKNSQLWVITIGEHDVQYLDPDEAMSGETVFWKLALWGTYIDKRALEQLRFLFPQTLAKIAQAKGWYIEQGLELRDVRKTSEKVEYCPDLNGQLVLHTPSMTASPLRFSIPKYALSDLVEEKKYIRRKTGLRVIQAPHIILSPSWMNYLVYSDQDFIIPPRQIGIAGASSDSAHLQALALYLNSSLVAYYLFFHVSEWGVFRQANRVTLSKVREIPTPILTNTQIQRLAAVYQELVVEERCIIEDFVAALPTPLVEDGFSNVGPRDLFATPLEIPPDYRRQFKARLQELRAALQNKIDDAIYTMFEIPEALRTLINEFIHIRLPLDTPSKRKNLLEPPSEQCLLEYATQLQHELDVFVFGKVHHHVAITHSQELIECRVETVSSTTVIPITSDTVKHGDLTFAQLLHDLASDLKMQLSQWVYIRRSLYLFEGPVMYIYKSPQRLNWTRTQAILDAGELIGRALIGFQDTDTPLGAQL